DRLAEHVMHSERFEVGADAAAAIARARERGGRIVAVGTTSLRALESAALRGRDGAALQPAQGETDLFVTPGFPFRVVDLLLTTFHLPKSTLLMLVAAFAGHERIRALYEHAIAERYRFFSYRDAMLLGREPRAAAGCPPGPAPTSTPAAPSAAAVAVARLAATAPPPASL